MDYSEGTNAISYAESLQGGDAALSSLIFDETVINCDSADFASAYSTIKRFIQDKLDDMVKNMPADKKTMENTEIMVKGAYKVPINYQSRYRETGGRLAE